MFEVIHKYDVDGGFGDAIPEEDVVARFETESEAKEFVARFAKPHIYSKPYDELWCGELVFEEVKLNTLADFEGKTFYWLSKDGWFSEYKEFNEEDEA